MIRNFKNFVVKEESSRENIKKIVKLCSDYGRKLLKGYIKDNQIILKFEEIYPDIHFFYNNNTKKFEVNIDPRDYLSVKDFKRFCDRCNNTLELIKKLENLDLMNLLPKFIE